MSSIREVARLAGVSPATVSRVINGTARVAPEKQAQVLKAIAETEFIPNEVARSLFKKSSRTIGLILPSIRNPFFTQLAGAVDEAAKANGHHVLLCNVGGDLEEERAALRMLTAMNADGVLIASTHEAIQAELSQCEMPVVAVDSLFDTLDINGYVYCDYYRGGWLAAQHLWECGCQNLVCIRGPQDIFSARARYRGYRDFCRAYGIPQQTMDCDYDFDAGMTMTEELLRTYPAVDGIVACNDIVAISIYKILHKRRIAVPDQIQLIGFDDIALSSLISPELTTIRQPIREMAAKAVELILGRKDAPKRGERHVFPVSLVVRETTRDRAQQPQSGRSVTA